MGCKNLTDLRHALFGARMRAQADAQSEAHHMHVESLQGAVFPQAMLLSVLQFCNISSRIHFYYLFCLFLIFFFFLEFAKISPIDKSEFGIRKREFLNLCITRRKSNTCL